MPFCMKEYTTWYLKFTFLDLVERMARDWSRVKPKLYTDISPYPRGCAWNRESCILAMRLIRFFAKHWSYLLYQDVSHGFDVTVSIIFLKNGLVTTRVWIVRVTPCAKSDPWVARVTLILVVANNTNSSFRSLNVTTNDIEPFFVAIVL